MELQPPKLQKQTKYEASASVVWGFSERSSKARVSADSSTPSFLFYPSFFVCVSIFNLYWVVWGSKP